MNFIVADDFATTGEHAWPMVCPTLSAEGVKLHCVEGMPRFDFVNGEWEERKISDGAKYYNATYECVALQIGGRTAALIMVRRVIKAPTSIYL